MKLHYSQTSPRFARYLNSFNTLWNYTTLKLLASLSNKSYGFNTLWNYTTLKHGRQPFQRKHSFNTLWNYTTLKHTNTHKLLTLVLIPYEITLLSNINCICVRNSFVLIPYEITLLSNKYLIDDSSVAVLIPYEITLLSNSQYATCPPWQF